MSWPHLVTFKTPTQWRTPSGGVTLTWADVPGLIDLPARVVPVPLGEGDTQAERMVLDRDAFTLIVAGDQAIERDMRAVASHLEEPLGVIAVKRPVLYGSPHTHHTIVEAERISAGSEAGS
jgi:hypothetical protein